MKNKLYGSFSFSFANNSQSIDSLDLKSRLGQYNLALKGGYNLVAKKDWVLSTYLGLRLFRFRHVTHNSNRRIDLDQFLANPSIDLRVSQFSAVGGINVIFDINDFWSAGLYLDYVQNLHRTPIVKVKRNRINSNIKNPIDHLLIGMGMGFGFSEWR